VKVLIILLLLIIILGVYVISQKGRSAANNERIGIFYYEVDIGLGGLDIVMEER